MDSHFYALSAIAVVFAGIAKGGFGGGPAFAASAILALVTTPTQAIGMMLPLLIVMDLGTLKPFWRKWDWPRARVMMLGAVPGVVLGAALYSITDEDVLRLLIGLLALVFVAWQILPKRTLRGANFSTAIGFLSGVVTGFTSFVSHAGGPPAAMYLLSQRLDKTTYHATMTLLFWLVNAAKVLPYAFLGIFTADTLKADLVLLPFALFGVWLGVRAHHVIPERAFFALTYVLLVLPGSKLVFEALT